MKPEYTEGPEALENFKRGMETLFKVPNSAAIQKEKQARKPSTYAKIPMPTRTRRGLPFPPYFRIKVAFPRESMNDLRRGEGVPPGL
jgi:hypothetical protein